jgi:hypothetical protein
MSRRSAGGRRYLKRAAPGWRWPSFVEAVGFTVVDTITEEGEQRVRYVRLEL